MVWTLCCCSRSGQVTTLHSVCPPSLYETHDRWSSSGMAKQFECSQFHFVRDEGFVWEWQEWWGGTVVITWGGNLPWVWYADLRLLGLGSSWASMRAFSQIPLPVSERKYRQILYELSEESWKARRSDRQIQIEKKTCIKNTHFSRLKGKGKSQAYSEYLITT